MTVHEPRALAWQAPQAFRAGGEEAQPRVTPKQPLPAPGSVPVPYKVRVCESICPQPKQIHDALTPRPPRVGWRPCSSTNIGHILSKPQVGYLRDGLASLTRSSVTERQGGPSHQVTRSGSAWSPQQIPHRQTGLLSKACETFRLWSAGATAVTAPGPWADSGRVVGGPPGPPRLRTEKRRGHAASQSSEWGTAGPPAQRTRGGSEPDSEQTVGHRHRATRARGSAGAGQEQAPPRRYTEACLSDTVKPNPR